MLNQEIVVLVKAEPAPGLQRNAKAEQEVDQMAMPDQRQDRGRSRPL